MNDKMITSSEIPEKIFSKNIFIIQDFNKEFEKEYFLKESYNISHKFLVKTIFNLLNTQIMLIFQLSKLSVSINSNNANDLVGHILSFNRDIMSRQIQKIISLSNNYSNSNIKPLSNAKTDMQNKKLKNNSQTKRELNKSFLTNASLINPNKYKKKIYKNLTTDSSYDLAGNCLTQTNDFKENLKSETLHSLRGKNYIAPTQKVMKTINNSSQINSRLISFIKNKNYNKNKSKDDNKSNKKKLNKLIKNDLSLSLLEKNEKEYKEKVNEDNETNNEEENPVRKVKNIIINAKKYSSLNKERFNGTIISGSLRKRIKNENDNKNHNLNSSNSNLNDRYKNLYYCTNTESFDEIKNKKKNDNIFTHDKSVSCNANISFRVQKDRETMQLLHDGMKNIKNKLNYNKLHQKD
jgi:hypothetical protein